MKTGFDELSYTDSYKKALESGDLSKAKGICDTDTIAKKQTDGYLKILNSFLNFSPLGKKAIDIGCGVGDITKNFHCAGMQIKGMEYSDEGVEVAKRFHPDLEFIKGDITKFREENEYDFIFTKQVYPFHSINAFTEQHRIISDLIDSLKQNGVLMVLVADSMYPHCLMHDLVSKTFKGDSRLSYVSRKMHDKIFEHFGTFIFGKISYSIIEILLRPYFWYKRVFKKWRGVYILVFQKAND